MELLDMELARARQRLNRAERSLERANEMLDDDRCRHQYRAVQQDTGCATARN